MREFIELLIIMLDTCYINTMELFQKYSVARHLDVHEDCMVNTI